MSVALVVSHVSVVASPFCTELGFAVKEAVGVGGGGVATGGGGTGGWWHAPSSRALPRARTEMKRLTCFTASSKENHKMKTFHSKNSSSSGEARAKIQRLK